MRSNHTVRIKSAGRYASGLLITKKHVTDTFVPSVTSISERATFILTADHFLRSCSKVIYVRGENFTATATTSLSVFGTDLGLIKLDGKAPTMPLPLFADKPLRVGMKTTTFGFGHQPPLLKKSTGALSLPSPMAYQETASPESITVP